MRVATRAGGVPLATAAVTLVTALNRLGVIPLHDLAGSPAAVAAGHEWLLVTSAFVADRPVLPSIAGFALVGIAVWLVSGARVLWLAAFGGQVLATVTVYAALDLTGENVTRADFGTSAIIAAWIGALAYRLHLHGSRRLAFGLCIAAALVGWFLRPQLDLLDLEHAVALPIGIAISAGVPRLRLPQLRLPQMRRALLLHTSLLRH
jgi:hypothetical protein